MAKAKKKSKATIAFNRKHPRIKKGKNKGQFKKK